MEAALDIKYLATRFEKGQQWATEYMATHHKFASVGSLSDAQAELINFQADSAANPCRGCMLFNEPMQARGQVDAHGAGSELVAIKLLGLTFLG